ncbi:MAG: MMPL family transporter, partial [bacterium]
MAKNKGGVEARFISFGRFIFRNRLKTILAVAVLIAGLASQLPKIVIDTSTEGFFIEGDPAIVAFESFREQFGREDVVIVAVRPPKVFEAGFLRKLKKLHDALEEGVPHMKEVTSLINARQTRGEGDELIVEDLLEEIPATAAEMADLRRRVLASPLYANFFISEDGGFTALVVEIEAYSSGQEAGDDDLAGFEEEATGPAPAAEPKTLLSDREIAGVVAAVEKIAAGFEGPDFEIFIAGTPVWTTFLLNALPRDMGRFMALAVLAIGTFLFLLFRRVAGVVLPLLIVILSLMGTIGLMAATGTALSSPTSILPSFLLAVGVGASVHLLAIFLGHYAKHHDKEEGIAYALGHSGLPILMTGLTTAAGLFSFVPADLAPVRDLGLFGGLGVLLSLAITLVLLPALIAVWPFRPNPLGGAKADGGGMERLLKGIADFSTGHPWGVVIVSTLIIAVVGAGLPALVFSHQPIRWIPESQKLRISVRVIDQELKGSSGLEVVVDSGEENGLYDPA